MPGDACIFVNKIPLVWKGNKCDTEDMEGEGEKKPEGFRPSPFFPNCDKPHGRSSLKIFRCRGGAAETDLIPDRLKWFCTFPTPIHQQAAREWKGIYHHNSGQFQSIVLHTSQGLSGTPLARYR